MTKPDDFSVMWEALSQYVSNQEDFVESLDPGKEYNEEAAKLAIAEAMLAKMDAKMATLAE